MHANSILSVIIPVHNRKHFLRQAVLSILHEGIEGTEILVVDDASTDGSLESVSDLPIVPISLSHKQGIAVAINEGIRCSTGKFVTGLGSDDLAYPGGFKARIQWLDSHPEAEVVGAPYAGAIDKNGNYLGSLPTLLGPRFGVLPLFLTLDYLKEHPDLCPSMVQFLFRREFLMGLGAFNPEFETAEDYDFLIRILKRTSVPTLPHPVAYYRLHETNTSIVQGDSRFQLKDSVLATERDIRSNHGLQELHNSL